ncbi:MAG: toll/interleukin-1 receptor domain-containing protein [Bryobacteraceae bacterium]|nr:toll/interleukin-1 receptor domain-containing protein [Bryobacteraceae bacterium]
MQPVFVSYAREDSKVALRLAADLKARRANVWIDQLDIHPGQQWDREVERALRECHELLAILSPASVESNNVMDEIAFAIDEGKTVIPVVVAECQVPFRLRRRQYIDLRSDYESGLQSLVATISGRPEAPVAPAPPVPEPVVESPRTAVVAASPAARRPLRKLLWSARILSVGQAVLAVYFSMVSTNNDEKALVQGGLVIALFQFAEWKWPTRAATGAVVVGAVTLLRIEKLDDFLVVLLFLCLFLLPTLLFFLHYKKTKASSSSQ